MTPVTRHETFLAAAAQGDSTLAPITREEYFLNNIADSVGSSETVTDTDFTLDAVANRIYRCGELDSITVSSFPETGGFVIIFTSGTTATDADWGDLVMPENFSVSTNTRYEVNVLDGYAVVVSWAVSASA